MSKVVIDTDKITNELLPMASNAQEEVVDAKSCARRAYFPYNDFGWGGVCGSLDECIENTRKYYNWANGLSQRFSTCLKQGLEDINSIHVESIKKSDLSVK